MSSFPNLPGYIFSNVLGQGSYAKVYKAYRKEGIRECVAIKCISKQILNKKASDNLISEIGILKELRHENIVQLLDFRWDSDYIYLILEFCSGGDLQKLIYQRRCLPETFVRRCLQQLSLALCYLHQRGIVHMDLKPQNILLSSSVNPVLKIADFGFAQCLEKTTTGSDIRGSPLYMAPEIFCRNTYSSKCDLWSVGVILYECLFGQAPFASKTYAELIQKHMSDAQIRVPNGFDISDDCRSLLQGLLQRNPDKRMNHEEFFAHPFVDLEHAPSSESLSKARILLDKATQFESNKELWKAYEMYTEGLTHLVAALHYERNPTIKVNLREEVNQLMTRAEMLSDQFLLGGSTREIATEETRMIDLKRSCSHDDNIQACAIFLDTFYKLVGDKKTQIALDYFTKEFAKHHQAVKNDTDAARKEKFYLELNKAMATAEEMQAAVKGRTKLDKTNKTSSSLGKNSCGVM